MQRFFIHMAYCGTPFHGWQIQPNARSVQETLEQVLSKLHGEQVSVVGCGRTDTGVHASDYYAHFELQQQRFEPSTLVFKLNNILPQEIAIYDVFEVNADRHARFSATSREYRYIIQQRKSPFLKDRVWQMTKPLDLKAMEEAGGKLFEFTDFTSFSKLHTDVKTNDCTILGFRIEQHEDQLIFYIKANRFLRNMVRAIVGTLVDVGLGKLTPEDFADIIHQKDRSKAGQSAPGEGLYLHKIEYPEVLIG